MNTPRLSRWLRPIAAAAATSIFSAGCYEAQHKAPIDKTMAAAHTFIAEARGADKLCLTFFDRIREAMGDIGLHNEIHTPHWSSFSDGKMIIEINLLTAADENKNSDIQADIKLVRSPEDQRRVPGEFLGTIITECRPGDKPNDPFEEGNLDLGTRLENIGVDVMGGNTGCIAMLLDAQDQVADREGIEIETNAAERKANLTADGGSTKAQIRASGIDISTGVKRRGVTMEIVHLKIAGFNGKIMTMCYQEETP